MSSAGRHRVLLLCPHVARFSKPVVFRACSASTNAVPKPPASSAGVIGPSSRRHGCERRTVRHVAPVHRHPDGQTHDYGEKWVSARSCRFHRRHAARTSRRGPNCRKIRELYGNARWDIEVCFEPPQDVTMKMNVLKCQRRPDGVRKRTGGVSDGLQPGPSGHACRAAVEAESGASTHQPHRRGAFPVGTDVWSLPGVEKLIANPLRPTDVPSFAACSGEGPSLTPG